MSLLDTASLIVTPNGYKEGKLYSVIPSDGSGDLSVTRATTATRVNSAGLVELVPYNLVQYSEDFSNAAWSKYQLSITSNNTVAPDGTMTADKITQTGAFAGSFYVYPFEYTNGKYTASCYFKKGTGNTAIIEGNPSTGSFSILYNLDTEIITPAGTGYVSSNIENLGNDWYRCSVVVNSIGTGYISFGSYNDNGEYMYAWGAQLNEGTIKDYQKTETRLNIPRLDYSNGTCPSLLVEPQRTNLLTYSSSFDTSPWIALGTSITPNTQTAPDGTLSGDTYPTSQSQLLLQTISASPSTTYTLSLWVKLGTATNICLVANNTLAWNTIGGQSFDSSDGLNTSTWARIEWTFTTPASLPAGAINIHLGGNSETGLTQSTGSVYIWGAQLEAGNYSTSYIPTTSASVTRNADVISKTGISSLIGQTEGVFFLDFYFDGVSSNFVLMQTFQNASQFNVNQLYLNSTKRLAFEVGPDAAILSPNSLAAGRYKIAGAYANNDFVLYLNGDLIGTDTSGSVISTDAITFNDYYALPDTYKQRMEINAAALWKTRLTNTQLAQLTTI